LKFRCKHPDHSVSLLAFPSVGESNPNIPLWLPGIEQLFLLLFRNLAASAKMFLFFSKDGVISNAYNPE
jgi:hypothetical protein